MKLDHRLSVLYQLDLHSQLYTRIQWIMEKNCQTSWKTYIFWDLVTYIRGLMVHVFVMLCFVVSLLLHHLVHQIIYIRTDTSALRQSHDLSSASKVMLKNMAKIKQWPKHNNNKKSTWDYFLEWTHTVCITWQCPYFKISSCHICIASNGCVCIFWYFVR